MFKQRELIPDEYDGLQFTVRHNDTVFTIKLIEEYNKYLICWYDKNENKDEIKIYSKNAIKNYIDKGSWMIVKKD